ncbi:pilus assembly protein TadG-related protein [Anaeromyxobacter paludicola]|uniref:pilus assembly protein TadG-related protein n=1 Tax=Anaeromyxobacter paludicola TaxID=2918171 RepID=UPI0020C006C8|nr:pilus assembly protein TadG-related protein [Anaeromyxobacter paludicola]
MALIIGGLAAFLALAINVGHLMEVRGQLQNAADAAALAGARELTGNETAPARARQLAKDFSKRHTSDRLNVQLADADITLGTMVETAPGSDQWAFSALPDSEYKQISAVRVVASRGAAATNSSVAVFMNKLLGAETTTGVSANAIGVVGGPCGQCSLPFALPDCRVRSPDGGVNCGTDLYLKNDTADTWGLTSLLSGMQANAEAATKILSVINGDPNACYPVHTGDPIPVQNGADIPSKLWDALLPWNGKEITLPLVQAVNCDINAPRFVQDPVVTGFALFTLHLAASNKDDPPAWMSVECKIVEPEEKWCPNFGVSATPRLIE